MFGTNFIIFIILLALGAFLYLMLRFEIVRQSIMAAVRDYK